MAQNAGHGSLPCLFCSKAFRSLRTLTTHLDVDHEKWIDAVMTRMGLSCPPKYPVQEYRLALAEVLLGQMPYPKD